jgi:putative transposase
MLREVLIRKAFRYRVYPSEAQIARLAAWEGALRFLWNIALEQRRYGLARPRDERVFPTAFDQIGELTALRAALPWLADVPRNVCAQFLAELDKAWQRCFKKLARAPRWKRKGLDALSFTEPHPKVWRLDEAVLRFPKLGNVRAIIHRPLEGKPKTCTLRNEGGHWFASILCEIEVAEPAPRDGPVVALDRGVVNVVGDSDGRLVPSPRFFESAQRRLANAQRSVSRKKKGSKNREKAKARVAILHRKVRRQREWFLHNLSSGYAKSHGVVVLERLVIGNMTKSASGTLEEPGRNVRAKTGLNRGILDAGWSRLGEMLDYKLRWAGGRVENEVAAFSSQTCSVCGHVDAASRVSQSVFRCTACGHTEHADLNAPKVLKQHYEARANRSGKPAEGIALEATRRSRKRVVLRVPRRTPESSVL